jgi:hypothetical protein
MSPKSIRHTANTIKIPVDVVKSDSVLHAYTVKAATIAEYFYQYPVCRFLPGGQLRFQINGL